MGASNEMAEAPARALPAPPPVSTLRALWTLTRPAGMVLVALLPLVGYAFAYWDHGCVAPGNEALPVLGFLMLVWAVPHAGTMWLNAALDRDEAPTLFGRAAPVPARIEWLAYGTLLFSLAVAAIAEWRLMLAVVGCAVLSVLYSHPRTAWKGHAVLGPLTNVLGYGVLSPLGGMFLTGYPLTIRSAMVLVTSVPWIAAAYFAAQAFQAEEDRARGYRTLVATHGPLVTLKVTRAAFVIALVLTFGLAAIGWFPRLVLVALPAFLWVDRVLVLWMREPNGGDASWAKRFFVRLALVGIGVVVLVSIDYEWSVHALGVPGGLATPSGRMEPRVCAPLWGTAG
jgi:4-hydroxybenzoate polyprenyltransferase